MNVSVVMATYNGSAYVKEQIDSILCQLESDDELIISDDKSTDSTIVLLKKYEENNCVTIIEGNHESVGKNFENGIIHCKNEIILLADQDDIWEEEKVQEIKRIFEENKNISVVMHNGLVFGKSDGILIKNYRTSVISNILKSNYWGCCMAVRRVFLLTFLPVKFRIIALDQLIGVLSEKYKQTYFYDKILIKHRIHDNNLSHKQLFLQRIKHRIVLFYQYRMCVKKIKSKEACEAE